MLTAERVLELLTSPREVLRTLNRRARRRVVQKHSAASVVDRDWDNLIILDACRYDIFAEEIEDTTFRGRLKQSVSPGTVTPDWITSNFAGRSANDIVCVSNNAWYEYLSCEWGANDEHWHVDLDLDFHAYVPVYVRDEESSSEALIEQRYELIEAAKAAAAEYPHKRLLVHMNLPHEPYIGDTGRRYLDASFDLPVEEAIDEVKHDDPDAILETAYRENLRIGLRELEQLVPELAGKTVISADHGELLGERYLTLPFKQYGHHGIPFPELVEVPWYVCEYDDRRETYPEKPVRNHDDTTREELEAHLQYLGYDV